MSYKQKQENYWIKLFGIISILLPSWVNLQADEVDLELFSENLVTYISNKDTSSVYALSCFPENSDCINAQTIKYIFGESKDTSSIRLLFANPKLKTTISEPFTYEDLYLNSSYIIAFYLPDNISQNKDGYFYISDIEREWGKSYIETVVTVIDGVIYLHRTIFYFGAHAPWTGEYG